MLPNAIIVDPPFNGNDTDRPKDAMSVVLETVSIFGIIWLSNLVYPDRRHLASKDRERHQNHRFYRLV